MKTQASCCTTEFFMYRGFCVQQGMIFGSFKGQAYVSNGYKSRDNFYRVYFHSVNDLGENVWSKRKLSFDQKTDIYIRIEKAAQKRDAKGQSVQYRNSDQLESVRWQRDDKHKHFQSHDPFATPKVSVDRNPNATAKYNAMKERSVFTQRINTVMYQQVNGVVII